MSTFRSNSDRILTDFDYFCPTGRDTVSQFSWIHMILTSKYCDSLGRGIHQELTSVEWFEKYLSRYLRNRYIDTWLLFLGTEPCIDYDIYLFLKIGNWWIDIDRYYIWIFWIRNSKICIFESENWNPKMKIIRLVFGTFRGTFKSQTISHNTTIESSHETV